MTPREKLEAAIQEYVADDDITPGVFLSGYALVAYGVVPDKPGVNVYRYVVPQDQARHASIGLASLLCDAVQDNTGFEFAEDGDDNG